jgi:hypothetical protein
VNSGAHRIAAGRAPRLAGASHGAVPLKEAGVGGLLEGGETEIWGDVVVGGLLAKGWDERRKNEIGTKHCPKNRKMTELTVLILLILYFHVKFDLGGQYRLA